MYLYLRHVLEPFPPDREASPQVSNLPPTISFYFSLSLSPSPSADFQLCSHSHANRLHLHLLFTNNDQTSFTGAGTCIMSRYLSLPSRTALQELHLTAPSTARVPSRIPSKPGETLGHVSGPQLAGVRLMLLPGMAELACRITSSLSVRRGASGQPVAPRV